MVLIFLCILLANHSPRFYLYSNQIARLARNFTNAFAKYLYYQGFTHTHQSSSCKFFIIYQNLFAKKNPGHRTKIWRISWDLLLKNHQ
ncbi:hypothetical protein B0181_07130 [Moraxella caviae]|uniref:Uncharacterized protein n=1 Tax=Moraxella caviae TaxID=34060 RepID=A0A1T0A123_9GAMM|nr:hypothetical protein B0181_07130 [Moraxella caviae]